MPYSMISDAPTPPKRPLPPQQTQPQQTQASPLPPPPGSAPQGYRYVGPAPMPEVPAGYQVTDVQAKEVTTYVLNPAKPLEKTPVKQTVVEFTLEPKPQYLAYGSDPYFGFTVVEPYETAPKELKQKAIHVPVFDPNVKPATGLGLATTAAVSVGVPLLGAAAVGGVGVAEAGKYGLMRQHLTIEEAVFAAGIAQASVYVAAKAAPYVQRGVSKVADYISPERALYRRVVQENLPEKPGFVERVVGKISPERALYNRVIKDVEKPSVPKDFGTGAGAEYVYKPSASGFAQSVLVKQASVQKAPMKPWFPEQVLQMPKEVAVSGASVVTIAETSRSATKAVTRQQTALQRSITQQVANPFLMYAGKPYYPQQRIREESEMAILSYPGQSFTPLYKQSQIPIRVQNVLNVPTQRQIPIGVQDVLSVPTQSQIFSETQFANTIQGQKQVEKQIQQQTTSMMQLTRAQSPLTQRYNLDSSLFLPVGDRRMSDPMGLFGRYKRVYPIKTAKQVIKELL